MGKRRLARETALQAIYLCDVSKIGALEAYAGVRERVPDLDEKSDLFAKSLVEGTAEHRGDLDRRIESVAENWELKRMAAVDRSILRLSAYELARNPDTPVGVIIDEAIEIAKKYSSENSSRFINGLLDKIKDMRAAKGT